MKRNFDIMVIGNGAIGCATAIRLALKAKDLKIALIGNNSRTGSASIAAGYMLNLFAELDDGYLERSAYTKMRFDLGLTAKAMWPNWAELLSELSGESFQLGMGTYVINNANATHIDDRNFDYIAKVLQKTNTPYSMVDPRDVKGFSPSESCRALRMLHIKDEGFFPSKKLFSIFDKVLASIENLEVVNDNALELKLDGSNKVITMNNGDTIFAPMTLISAGAYSQKFIEQLSLKNIPRVFFGTGTGLHVSINNEIPDFSFPLPDGVIRTTNRGNACGIHMVPYGDNECYIGASNLVTKYCEQKPRVAAVHGILESAMEELNTNFYKANFQTCLGHRPTSADIYPILGKVDSVDGLWIATGTKRDGLFLSPMISENIANEMLESGENTLPKAFKPERELIYDLEKEDAIQKNVLDTLSGHYQHSLLLPKTGMNQWLADKIREDIEAVYSKLGIENVGIPSELLNMYRHGHIVYKNTNG